MDAARRIERALTEAVAQAGHSAEDPAPPRLAAAMKHAVFPGGARVRPMLCLAVAKANGDDAPDLSLAAGASLELMHCASLVHDDLPCFDDADLRRGRPAVHVSFSEELAVLAGDALIVLAFETVARAAPAAPERLGALTLALGRATGMPMGICAGQGWESETAIDLDAYHRAKTGALFTAATRMGALAAGADPRPWAALGAGIGAAYQIADDLKDALMSAEAMGKPAQQDMAHGRPNAVRELGVRGAVARLQGLLAEAVDSIPSCPGEAGLRALVMAQAERLAPKALVDAV